MRDSLPIDMLLSAVSVLVVAQSSSEFPEGLMYNPVHFVVHLTPRRRWKDNLKMDLQEVRCGCMDWIDLAQDRDRLQALIKVVMYLWVP